MNNLYYSSTQLETHYLHVSKHPVEIHCFEDLFTKRRMQMSGEKSTIHVGNL